MTAWSHQMSLAPRPRAARRPSVRGRRLSFGVAAAALAITTIGLATGSAASAATAAASSSRVVTARTTTTFAMPAPGYNTVQSVTLSAGAWTVIAKATAVNSSTTDFARCQLYDATHSVSLDGATYQVGTTASTGGPITNLATLDVLAGATVQIQQRCGHDGAAGDAAPDLDVDVDGGGGSDSADNATGAAAVTERAAPVSAPAVAPEPRAPEVTPGRVAALPAARRLASDLGVDLDTIGGTGQDGDPPAGFVAGDTHDAAAFFLVESGELAGRAVGVEAVDAAGDQPGEEATEFRLVDLLVGIERDEGRREDAL